ncbi:MAG: hypothetical protein ACP5N2_01920 [Candidatus Nanoarchaeia archaeon]
MLAENFNYKLQRTIGNVQVFEPVIPDFNGVDSRAKFEKEAEKSKYKYEFRKLLGLYVSINEPILNAAEFYDVDKNEVVLGLVQDINEIKNTLSKIDRSNIGSSGLMIFLNTLDQVIISNERILRSTKSYASQEKNSSHSDEKISAEGTAFARTVYDATNLFSSYTNGRKGNLDEIVNNDNINNIINDILNNSNLYTRRK